MSEMIGFVKSSVRLLEGNKKQQLFAFFKLVRDAWLSLPRGGQLGLEGRDMSSWAHGMIEGQLVVAVHTLIWCLACWLACDLQLMWLTALVAEPGACCSDDDETTK
jgi:hypothetical protein